MNEHLPNDYVEPTLSGAFIFKELKLLAAREKVVEEEEEEKEVGL